MLVKTMVIEKEKSEIHCTKVETKKLLRIQIKMNKIFDISNHNIVKKNV